MLLPDDLKPEPDSRRVTFSMDYTPGVGWSAVAVEPAGWAFERSVGEHATREELCELIYRTAREQFGADVTVVYSDTALGARQSAREDEHDHVRLDCPLCNPEHPDHEREVAAYWAPLN